LPPPGLSAEESRVGGRIWEARGEEQLASYRISARCSGPEVHMTDIHP
jgi:hypothetical protein